MDNMKHKQILIIREQPEITHVGIKQVKEDNITTCCCVNQGVSKLETVFDKDTFEPHEHCKVNVLIDNSKCNVDIKRIRFGIEQEINL